MKKFLALGMALMLLFSIAACAPTAAPAQTAAPAATPAAVEATPAPTPSVADGTYEGTSTGFNGELKVAVTVAGGAIEKVEVLSHSESAGVADDIIAAMPELIVKEQSYGVDALSGATFTSNAIKFAVKDALTKAGAVEGQFDVFPVHDVTEETIDVDVVVIGAGIAGLSAAIEAKEAGANVIILEKLARMGGSSVTSGGIVYATNSPLNGSYDNDPDDMVAYYQKRANGKADEALLKYAAEHSGETVQWLMDQGVEFKEDVVPTGLSTAKRGHYATQGGPGVINPLKEKVKALGIPVYLETPATELITDTSGAITGVKAESKYTHSDADTHTHTSYTINAKAVVMATGGFDASQDMKALYAPNAESAACMSSVGNTGEGIVMGEKAGAATFFPGGVIGFRAVNPAIPYSKGVNGLVWAGTLAVTDEGIRFTNETADYPVFFTKMVETGREDFYFIFDSNAAELCETAVAQGMGFKADSIEELAAAAGMDATTLKATFDRYQELAAAGKDEDFGKASIAPLSAEGPYYAVRFKKATIGSFGGLVINTKSEVLSTEGTPIPGFYAAGECANGQFFDQEYPASGTMLSLSTTYGRTAGANAAAYAAK